MDNKTIEAMKASLTQAGSAYSPAELKKELNSLEFPNSNASNTRILCNSETSEPRMRFITEGLDARKLTFTKHEDEKGNE